MRKYRSSFKPRSIRNIERKNKKKFIWSIIISLTLFFVLFKWGLPLIIGPLSKINQVPKTTESTTSSNAFLPPPVLNIPFEATNSAQLLISGNSTPEAKVEIYLDDSLVSSTKTNPSGEFISDLITLTQGTNNIYGKTIDEDDKESLPSKNIQLVYSSDLPPLEISEPSDNKEIKGGDKKITISGKTEAEVEVLVNNSRVIVKNDGTFTTTINLNDGDNPINIKATNIFGNSTIKDLVVKYLPS